MLRVVTPAAARAFTDLVTVKADLGLSGTDQDARLARFIREAGEFIERTCGRVFPRETVEETVEGSDDVLLVLERRPVVEIVSVLCGGEVLLDATVEDADAGLLRRDEGWLRQSILAPSLFSGFPIASGAAVQRYTIRYTAGYKMVDYAVPAECNLPDSLIGIATDYVRYRFEGRSVDQSLSQHRMGDETEVYRQGREILVDFETRLFPWRG